MNPQLDRKLVAVVKGLVMDATRKANSGHPGGPMSSADFAAVLFSEFLHYDPTDTGWFDRDRFVLSCGHESSLLYALLHLVGHVSLDDLKNFRQYGSKTPGHPELGVTPGVEATTGPLGQGLAMAVGMAAAEAHLRARLGPEAVDHHTYVIASDGDLQEGVSFGAASLAGVWGLSRLVVFFDSNKIQLAGPTSRCDCTDYKKIYEGICWNVIEIDGHDHEAIRGALKSAQFSDKPTLIIGHTVMAKGTASLEGSHETHGAPLSPEEIKATKARLGLPPDEAFYVPEDVVAHFRRNFPRLAKRAADWRARVEKRLQADKEFAALREALTAPRSELKLAFPPLVPGEKIATRSAWGTALMALKDQLPGLIGGSADLDPSNQTEKFRKAVGNFGCDGHAARNLAFGVREFPMGAILNGIALHGGLIPFGATFLAFADYMRGALRLSALQRLPVLNVFTHDSFYVGEDGPTHQPVEHADSLRLIPDMLVFRPADATETYACLRIALTTPDKPSCLLLTRQNLPVLGPADHPNLAGGPARGAYTLKDCAGEPEVVIMATGSEVHLALAAAASPELAGTRVRVVSAPCLELYDAQDAAYKSALVPPGTRLTVGVEAGRSDLWYKYLGRQAVVLGLDHFGHSAPAGVLAEKYGFTAANLVRLIREHL
jgi:transketolase